MSTMICQAHRRTHTGRWFLLPLKVVGWLFALWFILSGLTACKNSEKALQFSRSKFDVQTDGQMQRGKSSIRGRNIDRKWFWQSKDRKPK